MEHSRYVIVVGTNWRREANETDCTNHRRDGCGYGLRNDAKDPDVPGWLGHCRDGSLSASAATAPATAAADDDVPGWLAGRGWHGLPDAAAPAAAATPGADDDPLGRTRLNLPAGAKAPAAFLSIRRRPLGLSA